MWEAVRCLGCFGTKHRTPLPARERRAGPERTIQQWCTRDARARRGADIPAAGGSTTGDEGPVQLPFTLFPRQPTLYAVEGATLVWIGSIVILHAVPPVVAATPMNWRALPAAKWDQVQVLTLAGYASRSGAARSRRANRRGTIRGVSERIYARSNILHIRV